MSNSESSRKNAKWEPNSTKVILDICMEEVRKRGKPGIKFKSEKWEDIREEFERQTNKSYTQKQLKSKMYNLRTDLVTWKQLVGKETYLTMNNQTGTIEADAAWWDAKIRENAKYGKFRHRGLKFLNDLEFIFGEIVETSQDASTPTRSVTIETSGINTTPNVSNTESDNDDFNAEDGSSPSKSTQPKRKRNAPQDINNRVTKARGEVQVIENHNEADKDEIAVTSYFHGQYSISNCTQVLNILKEGGRLDGQQFCYALELLRDSFNRAILISLKDSEDSLVEWILYKYKS
ncbi:L10-interacting MYB domain-containing protein-like [Lotus japonicus]|uniref:L10-interacting MYB domain-containing protein-like n=1 Tax=Lotus japonicus TaxID=34305 RepID=UPI002586E3F4|nr:L10-interacting MYB domain-containing protein-like [Lotus japonicus]